MHENSSQKAKLTTKNFSNKVNFPITFLWLTSGSTITETKRDLGRLCSCPALGDIFFTRDQVALRGILSSVPEKHRQ